MHLDLGSGDGRGPLRWARRAPDWFFLASDVNSDALCETAARAARKPARGGVLNLLCIAEPVDVLARELAGIADRLTVMLPWGSLLRGLIQPEVDSLQHLHEICAPNATIEIVFSYDGKRDARDRAPLGAEGIAETHIRALVPLYEGAGFRMISAERIHQLELNAYDTTWGKRLAFGQPREVWRLRGLRLE